MKSPEATPITSVKETEANVREKIWRFIADTLKRGLKYLLEEEVTSKVKARKYERSPTRQGYRGGHYLRNLVTRYGLLEGFAFPDWQKVPWNSNSSTNMSVGAGMWMLPSVGSSSGE